MLERSNSDYLYNLIKTLKNGNKDIDDFIKEISKLENGDLGRISIRKRLLELNPKINLWVFFALLLISESGGSLSKSYFLDKLNDIKYVIATDYPLYLFDGYKRMKYNKLISNDKELDKFLFFNQMSIILYKKRDLTIFSLPII